MWRLLARVGVAALVLAAGLGFVGSAGAAAQTVADAEARDRLIADQEALLNVYRCMFNLDTQVVPGGCLNGSPISPPQGPSQFSGTPTAQDVAIRDQLVADQEALLNVYRCQFSIDTELVPNGCQDGAIDSEPSDPTAEPSNLGPIPPDGLVGEYFGWMDFTVECEYSHFRGSCRNPEDTQTLLRGLRELFGCEINPNGLDCVGFGHFAMDRLISSRSCPEGWYLDFLTVSRMCWHPSHPDFEGMVPRYIYDGM